MELTVSTSIFIIVHEMICLTSVPDVNADTDFLSAPASKLGHVLKKYQLANLDICVARRFPLSVQY